MNLLIAAHNDLENGRGGETSVGIIRDYLRKRHQVRVAVRPKFNDPRFHWADLVLTWGLAAEETHRSGSPYILMVRWWRNVAPIPPGDLMKRRVDPVFIQKKAPLFRDALAVVTNNEYAARVIDRWQGADAFVSYVPVLGKPCGEGNPKGTITLVTDNKALGEPRLIRALARLMPNVQFLVVNAHSHYEAPNVEALPYSDLDEVYRRTGVLLYPVYGNDVCGTSRVMPEAWRYGIPTLATDRSGLCEKGGIPVRRDADPTHWASAIRGVLNDYGAHSKQAIEWFRGYDTAAQLKVFDEIIEQRKAA